MIGGSVATSIKSSYPRSRGTGREKHNIKIDEEIARKVPKIRKTAYRARASKKTALAADGE